MTMAQETVESLDLDYIAICIAEQIVRVKISVARQMRGNERAFEAGLMLTRPLMALAAQLGVRDQVEVLVAEALPGAVG